MDIEYRKIKDLTPYEKNPRKNDEAVKYVANSIKSFGFKVPIVIDKDGVIVAGHTRLKAAKKLKLKEVPCIIADDLTEEQIKAFRLADNKVSEFAEWDFSFLTDELDGILDIDMTDFGFSVDLGDEPPTEIEEDKTPELPEEPKPKPGDLYKLGNHRLICGDSTDIKTIERLLDGAKLDMLLTDPPYNIELGGGDKDTPLIRRRNRRNKNIEHLADFNPEEIEYIFSVFDNITFYIFTSKDLVPKYLNMGAEWDFNILIWRKTNPMPLTNYTFLSDLEYCLFFHRGDRVWNNGLKPFEIYSRYHETTITEGSKDAGKVHPTMKPVSILTDYIRLSSTEGGGVLDMFGGSGSTLIACEKTGRKCFMSEIDPQYVDVIIQRWENLTGKKAELIESPE